MGKAFFYGLIVLLISCNNNHKASKKPEDGYSAAQRKLDSLVKRYKVLDYEAPNDIARKELKEKFLDTIKSFLTDTLNYAMPNFKITIDELDVKELGDQKAFYAKFYDNNGYEYGSVANNVYWMEFDYPADSMKSLEKNPAYQLLKNMPRNTDTVLSFFYMGEVEWDYLSSDRLTIRVVPFPKNFNFDSSRKKNLKPKK